MKNQLFVILLLLFTSVMYAQSCPKVPPEFNLKSAMYTFSDFTGDYNIEITFPDLRKTDCIQDGIIYFGQETKPGVKFRSQHKKVFGLGQTDEILKFRIIPNIDYTALTFSIYDFARIYPRGNIEFQYNHQTKKYSAMIVYEHAEFRIRTPLKVVLR